MTTTTTMTIIFLENNAKDHNDADLDEEDNEYNNDDDGVNDADDDIENHLILQSAHRTRKLTNSESHAYREQTMCTYYKHEKWNNAVGAGSPVQWRGVTVSTSAFLACH